MCWQYQAGQCSHQLEGFLAVLHAEPGTTCAPFQSRYGALQGDCSSASEDLTLQELLVHPRSTPSQCVLRGSSSFLEVPQSTDGALEPNRLWLDNLYITTGPPGAGLPTSAVPPTLVTVAEGSELWMTHISLIGSRRDTNTTSGGVQQPAQLSRGMHALPGSSVLARSACPSLMRYVIGLRFEWTHTEATQVSSYTEPVP